MINSSKKRAQNDNFWHFNSVNLRSHFETQNCQITFNLKDDGSRCRENNTRLKFHHGIDELDHSPGGRTFSIPKLIDLG